MTWKRDQFPVQDQVLYEIQIRDGRFLLEKHDRYEIHKTEFRTSYRVHTGRGICVRTSDQLDRVLNGRLWTFDPDLQRAAGLFRERAASDITKADALRAAAESLSREIDKAVAGLTGAPGQPLS